MAYPTNSRPHSLTSYPEGCAAPGNVQGQCNALGPLSKLKRAPTQGKIFVTSKSPVGDISVVTLIRTDTTLDHSQKAEKVWVVLRSCCGCVCGCAYAACLCFAFGCAPVARLRAPLRQLCVCAQRCIALLGRSPRKNCKNDLDDQT